MDREIWAVLLTAVASTSRNYRHGRCPIRVPQRHGGTTECEKNILDILVLAEPKTLCCWLLLLP